MTRTVLLTEHDLTDWRRRYAVGDAPAPLPYGVNALEAQGFRLHGVGQSSGRWGTKLRHVAEHRSGMVVERPLRAMPATRRADLVLALLEPQAMVPGLLKDRGIPPYSSTPLVIWSCWLADDITRASPDRRAWLARRIRSADLITHMSRHEAEVFVDLGIPAERLFPVSFGVSHEFYVPGTQERDIDILAVGQDRGRDYATLVEAVRGTHLTLDLVSRPENLVGLDLPSNVRVHGTVPLSTYREMLQRARIVAVPTHNLTYPTGQSVALEASSSGCAVVVTGTRAMRDYFTDHGTARLVDEGDVAGWRDTLTELAQDPAELERLGRAARDNVTGRFNADHMWTELAAVLHERGLTRDA